VTPGCRLDAALATLKNNTILSTPVLKQVWKRNALAVGGFPALPHHEILTVALNAQIACMQAPLRAATAFLRSSK
jgi:hypothetical protein